MGTARGMTKAGEGALSVSRCTSTRHGGGALTRASSESLSSGWWSITCSGKSRDDERERGMRAREPSSLPLNAIALLRKLQVEMLVEWTDG